MRKILGILFVLMMISSQANAAYQWREGAGINSILGTESAADIDAVSYQHIVNPLDRVLANYRRGCKIRYLSASTVTVDTGEVVVSNSAGTIRLMQQNTSATTVDITTDLDTGSEASSTTYYVYAYQDTVTTATFSVVLSTSSTAPSGKTYYRRLGSFYNNSSSAIERIANDDNIGNQVHQVKGVTSSPTTTSTSYVDLTDMSITITTGASPVLILFSGSFRNSASGNRNFAIIDIDGTNKTESQRCAETSTAGFEDVISTSWIENVSAGSHTFKIEWKTDSGTATAQETERTLQVIELR